MTDALYDEQGLRLDQIQLLGLAGYGHHGVFDHEKAQGQNFVVDVTIHLDTRRAARTDEVSSTIHYGEVAEDVVAVITGESVDLIETLAAKIADVVLARPGAYAVDVAVHKPQAPITVPFSDVVISVRRLASEKSPAPKPDVEPAPVLTPLPAPSPAPAAILEPPSAPEPVASVPAVPVPLAPLPVASVPTAAELGVFDDRLTLPVEVVLALGANLGSPQRALREAIADLHRTAGLTVLKVSPIARTSPVGGPEQPDYLNAVIIAETTLSPRELLTATQAIENKHGRERLEVNGPRTLDIDVITYGDMTSDDVSLTIPHPRARERAFVLVPWVHIQPQGVLQGIGYVSDIVDQVDQSGIRYLALDWFDPATLTETGEADGEGTPRGSSDAAGDIHTRGRASSELNTGAVRISGHDDSLGLSAAVPSFDELLSPGSSSDAPQHWAGS